MKYTYFLLLCFFLVGQASAAQTSCDTTTASCGANEYYDTGATFDPDNSESAANCCTACVGNSESDAGDNVCHCQDDYYNTQSPAANPSGSDCLACLTDSNSGATSTSAENANECTCTAPYYAKPGSTDKNGAQCSACAANYYNSDTTTPVTAATVECSKCYPLGTDSNQNNDGNTLTVCTCEDNYGGTTCGQCGVSAYALSGTYAADPDTSTLECDACHAGSTQARGAAHTLNNCLCGDYYRHYTDAGGSTQVSIETPSLVTQCNGCADGNFYNAGVCSPCSTKATITELDQQTKLGQETRCICDPGYATYSATHGNPENGGNAIVDGNKKLSDLQGTCQFCDADLDYVGNGITCHACGQHTKDISIFGSHYDGDTTTRSTTTQCDCEERYASATDGTDSNVGTDDCNLCDNTAYATSSTGALTCVTCDDTLPGYKVNDDLGHRELFCECKDNYYADASSPTCNGCATTAYKSAGENTNPTCSTCYVRGSNTQTAGHTEAECSCKGNYGGTECLQCAIDNHVVGTYSNDAISASHNCDLCYVNGLKADGGSKVVNNLESCDCADFYFSDTTNRKCDRCTEKAYRSSGTDAAPTCSECTGNGHVDDSSRNTGHTNDFCTCDTGPGLYEAATSTHPLCDKCTTKAYFSSSQVCTACYTAGNDEAASSSYHQNDKCTCKSEYYSSTSLPACDKCASGHFDSEGNSAAPTCQQCHGNGFDTDYGGVEGSGKQNAAGNVATSCVCKTGYTEDACDYCVGSFYNTGAANNAFCQECHPTKSGYSGRGFHHEADCTYESQTCATGHAGVNCDNCVTSYYVDTTQEYTSAVTNDKFNICDACHSRGTPVPAASDPRLAVGGHTEPNCGVCNTNYATSTNPKCILCETDAYDDGRNPADTDCQACYASGRASLARTGGHTNAFCDCNTGYSNSDGYDTGNVAVENCRGCQNTYYDTDSSADVTCALCSSAGHNPGVNGHDNGHTKNECECKEESFTGSVATSAAYANRQVFEQYVGAACDSCGEYYYKTGTNADSFATCSICYIIGTDPTQNPSGNTETQCHCNAGFFQDSSNPLCNKCSAGYYDNDGVYDAAGTGTDSQQNNADNNQDSIQCAICHPRGVDLTVNKDNNVQKTCACIDGHSPNDPRCDSCDLNFFDDSVNGGVDLDCEECWATGTIVTGDGNVDGNVRQDCKCKEGFSETATKKCDTCAAEYYDEDAATGGVQCADCHAGGTKGTGAHNSEGNTETVCHCEQYYTGEQCHQCTTEAYNAGGATAAGAPDCVKCGNNAMQAGSHTPSDPSDDDETQCDCDLGYYSNDKSRNYDVLGTHCDYCDTNYYSHHNGNGNARTCEQCSQYNTMATSPNDNVATNSDCDCKTGFHSSFTGFSFATQGRACDQCAIGFKSNNLPYTDPNVQCIDCDTLGSYHSNAPRNTDGGVGDFCDYCDANAYYKLVANTGSNNKGHVCTPCPGSSTTNAQTQSTSCLGSCAASFAAVSTDANNYHVVESCYDVVAVGATRVNYHNKGGSAIDLRDVEGNDVSTCCDENECNVQERTYWEDPVRFCGIVDASSKTVSGLQATTYNNKYCVDSTGNIIDYDEVGCVNRGTWVSDGYKKCDITCTSNGKQIGSNPEVPSHDFTVTTGGEFTCLTRTIGEWSTEGCEIGGDVTGTRRAELGTVSGTLGYNQCLVWCPVDNAPFTLISYENCDKDERGNGLTCTPCIYGSTNEAGDPAGPVPTFCTEVPVDAYLVDDPEASVVDFSSASSECSNIDPKQYAKIHTDGTVSCEPCGREGFMESYNANTMDSPIVGTRHGVCCQNSHHKVCRAMLEEYKIRCEYEDKVATVAANFHGSWYGKGKDDDANECQEYSP